MKSNGGSTALMCSCFPQSNSATWIEPNDAKRKHVRKDFHVKQSKKGNNTLQCPRIETILFSLNNKLCWAYKKFMEIIKRLRILKVIGKVTKQQEHVAFLQHCFQILQRQINGCRNNGQKDEKMQLQSAWHHCNMRFSNHTWIKICLIDPRRISLHIPHK